MSERRFRVMAQQAVKFSQAPLFRVFMRPIRYRHLSLWSDSIVTAQTLRARAEAHDRMRNIARHLGWPIDARQ